METNDLSLKKERQPNPYAITSLVLAIVPFIIWLLIIVFLGESDFGFAAGASWPFVLLLGAIAMIAVPVADILAVIFGIIAIVKRKTFFSWLGIIIVFLEVLIFVVM